MDLNTCFTRGISIKVRSIIAMPLDSGAQVILWTCPEPQSWMASQAASCRGQFLAAMIIITTTLRSLSQWRNHDHTQKHSNAMHIITSINYYQVIGKTFCRTHFFRHENFAPSTLTRTQKETVRLLNKTKIMLYKQWHESRQCNRITLTKHTFRSLCKQSTQFG